MAEQLDTNLYRLDIPLVGNPLKNLNSYLITGEKNLLIDTGFNEPTCKEAMMEQLHELNIDLNKTDILLTHVHYDHSGLCTFLHREYRRIFLSTIDTKIMYAIQDPTHWHNRYARCIRDGFTEEETKGLWGTNPAQNRGPGPYDAYFLMEDKMLLNYGGIELECILTPGHTPGHICVYAKEKKWLFTGDHVLYHITPNITAWPNVPDSLGDYLASLDKLKNLEVEKVFPAHRAVESNFYKRLDELKDHHLVRLEEALNIVRCTPGLTAYEIAAKMRWSIRARDWADFPLPQKFFATGEAKAHLDYLEIRGKVKKVEGPHHNRYY